MTIEVAIAAGEQLTQIHSWNISAYGVEHANRYVDLIRQKIGTLGLAGVNRTQVDDPCDVFYTLVEPRPRRHGHVIVYRIDQATVFVLHIFHTAQDWQNKI